MLSRTRSLQAPAAPHLRTHASRPGLLLRPRSDEDMLQLVCKLETSTLVLP